MRKFAAFNITVQFVCAAFCAGCRGEGIESLCVPYNNGMEYEKVYVEVVAKFPAGGGMRPLYLVWEDGKKYEIDRVKFAERAPARVSSVLPVRYTCLFGGRERYLYFEEKNKRWFVERER